MLRKMLSSMLRKLPWHSYLKAILIGCGIDYFERYLFVIRFLKCLERKLRKQLRIVEVGSGPGSPLRRYFSNTVLLDVEFNIDIDVVADAAHLPFRDKVFDIAVAVDLLEHIIPDKRNSVLKELFRVAKFVIIHTPLISKDGLFNSRFYDYLLLKSLRQKLGINHPCTRFTMEHLRYGQPAHEDLQRSGFKLIKYDWNAKVWYCIMKIQLTSHGLASRLMWLVYLLLFRHLKDPPYWGGFLIAASMTSKSNAHM